MKVLFRLNMGTREWRLQAEPPNLQMYSKLLATMALPPVASCLRNEVRGLKRLLLEVLSARTLQGLAQDGYWRMYNIITCVSDFGRF